ncbi:MAG: hypothetical protein MZU97_03965 [Bacillus subtilis]|nr:hypothetical protein [Bacillus subtilis]
MDPAKLNYEAILIEDNHLGNQIFGLRNAEWYFASKKLPFSPKSIPSGLPDKRKNVFILQLRQNR